MVALRLTRPPLLIDAPVASHIGIKDKGPLPLPPLLKSSPFALILLMFAPHPEPHLNIIPDLYT